MGSAPPPSPAARCLCGALDTSVARAGDHLRCGTVPRGRRARRSGRRGQGAGQRLGPLADGCEIAAVAGCGADDEQHEELLEDVHRREVERPGEEGHACAAAWVHRRRGCRRGSGAGSA